MRIAKGFSCNSVSLMIMIFPSAFMLGKKAIGSNQMIRSPGQIFQFGGKYLQ